MKRPHDDDEPSSPQDDDVGTSSESRDVPECRRASLKEAAAILNVDRNTFAKWLDQDCPYLQRADRDRGVAWIVDIAAVVKWLQERAVASALAKYEGDGERVSEGEAKRRKLLAAAIIEEIEASRQLRTVVPMDYVFETLSKDYAEIRSLIAKIPDLIAANVESSIAAHVRKIADKQIRDVMETLQVTVEDFEV